MKCKRNDQLTQKSKTIGKRIRWLRYTKSMSLKEVALLLDISVPALSKIENGTTDMNLSRLMQIAGLFKVTTIALIDDDEPGVRAEAEENLLLKEKLYKSEQEVIRLQRRLVELYEGLEKYITSK